MNVDINLWAVLLAAVSSMIVGSIWYMPAVFGNTWMKLTGTEMKGKGMVVFSLGYSHPVEYPLPSGVDCAIDAKLTKLSLNGIDRQKVGQVAAEMRSLRPPDPYKNKGVRYAGEKLKGSFKSNEKGEFSLGFGPGVKGKQEGTDRIEFKSPGSALFLSAA